MIGTKQDQTGLDLCREDIRAFLGGSIEDRLGVLFAGGYCSRRKTDLPPLIHLVFCEESYRLLYLIKENTFVKKKPFLRFTDSLLEVLCGVPTIGDLRKVFADYRRNPDNFQSLGDSTARVPVNGHFMSCAVAPEHTFMVVSRTAQYRLMPDYDMTVSDDSNRKWLIDEYFNLLDRIGLTQVCFLEKEFGPLGPLGLRDDFDSKTAREAGVRNSFTFRQADSKIVIGRIDPELPVVLLYDIMVTGDGIVKAARTISNQISRQYKHRPSIYAFILYSYESLSDMNLTLWDAFNPKDEGVDSAGRRVFNRVVALKYPGIKAESLKPYSVPSESGPFNHHRLEDIDPLASVRPDLSIDMAYANSKEVKKSNAGKWVAVLHKKVVGSWATQEEALAASRDRDAFVTYVRSGKGPVYEF